MQSHENSSRQIQLFDKWFNFSHIRIHNIRILSCIIHPSRNVLMCRDSYWDLTLYSSLDFKYWHTVTWEQFITNLLFDKWFNFSCIRISEYIYIVLYYSSFQKCFNVLRFILGPYSVLKFRLWILTCSHTRTVHDKFNYLTND
jgi:hypothetical protein